MTPEEEQAYLRGLGRHGEGGTESDFDRYSADIPIWGWLSGANGRRDAARGERDADRNRRQFGDLAATAPSEQDLTVDYGQDAGVAAPGMERAGSDPLAQRAEYDALRRLQALSHGGLTEGDHAMMDETRRREDQVARSQREAALQQMEARGMGGSGTALAGTLAGSEAAGQRASSMDAQMMAHADDRAMQALAGYGQLGSQMRQEGSQESQWNAGQGNDWNRWNTTAERERSRFNTSQGDRSRESRRDAAQTAYENREHATAGATGQYTTDVGRRTAAGQRQDQQNRDAAAGLGTLLASL